MNSRLLVAALAAPMLAGCATGTQYVRPQPALPVSYSVSLPGTKQVATDARTPATPAQAPAATSAELAQWWRQFDDPLLTQMVERGLDANRDIRVALARIREVRALRTIADARALPEISLSGSTARDRISQNGRLPAIGIPNPATVYQAGFDATWEIDAFGGVRHARDAAAAELERTELDRAAVEVSVSAEIVSAYLRMRGAQSQVAVLDEQLNVARETITIASARVKSGLVSELDLLRAREVAESLAARRPLLQADADVAIRTLGVLTGAQASSLVSELTAQRPLPQIVPQLPPAVPAQLLARRPDLRAIERALAAENARIGVADAERYPSLSASLALGLLSLATGNFATAASAAWNAGASFSAPVYNGGSRNARLEAARARYEQAALRYDGAAARAVEEVESAALRYTGSRERREKLAEALRVDEDARNLAVIRYQGGLANFLEVLDAQRQLFALQSEELVSREEALYQLVALYKALGGGWSASQKQASAAAQH
jgi:multidrug efflux system outer membrane protein